MSNKKFGRIFIELDGDLTDISGLDKEDYEDFLEMIHRLRIAYITTIIKN